jgi:hypothetical protein
MQKSKEIFENIKKNAVTVLAIMLTLFVALAGYLYTQIPKSASATSEKEIQSFVREVGKLIVLPEGETPTLATVSDPERLRDQPFFARAKAGDKVLLYSNARKAFLYDPIAKKLIEVAPLNLGGNDVSLESE